MKKVWICWAAVVLVGVLTAIFAVSAANDALALDAESGKVQIRIDEGQSVYGVATELKENGIISNKTAFLIFATVTGSADKFKAGVHSIDKSMDYLQIVTVLKRNGE